MENENPLTQNNSYDYDYDDEITRMMQERDWGGEDEPTPR